MVLSVILKTNSKKIKNMCNKFIYLVPVDVIGSELNIFNISISFLTIGPHSAERNQPSKLKKIKLTT